MECVIQKILVILWCCVSCAFFMSPVFAQESDELTDEDVEWLDEEDEEEENISSLESESDAPPSLGASDTGKNTVPKREKEESADLTDEDIEWLDEEDEEERISSLESERDAPSPAEEGAPATAPVDAKGDEDGPTASAEDQAGDETADAGDEESVEEAMDPAKLDESAESADSMVDEYEQSLYETYVQYYSKQISVEEWERISGGKDEYIIREKDTLWDISKVLFGDSHYWPKLWSVNPAISNPHLILPNNSLGFIHGTEGSAPFLSLLKGGGSGSSSSLPPDFFKGKKIDVPSSKKTTPIMQNIPSSLPPLRTSEKQEEDLSDVEVNFKAIAKPTMSVLSYYMSEEPIVGDGFVYGKKDYGSSFHVGQRVILEMRESINPGDKLIAVRDRGKLYPSSLGVRGPFGYQVEVQGEVEIIGRVPDSFDLYEAKVTRSFNPIAIGSLVLTGRAMEFDYQPTDIAGNAEAQIIGVPSLSESHVKSIASPYSTVYLNRGKGSGLSVGQMYQVLANLDVREDEEYGYDIKVGEVKIIYAEDRFATGLVTEMSNSIRVGDYIVPLSEGLSVQRGYDPLNEAVGAPAPSGTAGFDDFDDFEELEEGDIAPEKEPTPPGGAEAYDDEDVFEAFE